MKFVLVNCSARFWGEGDGTSGRCKSGKRKTYGALCDSVAEAAGAETAPSTSVSESAPAGGVAVTPVTGTVGVGDGDSALGHGSSDNGGSHFDFCLL